MLVEHLGHLRQFGAGGPPSVLGFATWLAERRDHHNASSLITVNRHAATLR
jgi:hypothetical protein